MKTLPIILSVCLFLMLGGIGLTLRSHDQARNAQQRALIARASASRHELCVRIEQIKTAERQLWLGVIRRTPNKDAKPVTEFVADLYRFFPKGDCQ